MPSNSSDDNFLISSINTCSSFDKFKLTDSLNLKPLPLCLDIISGSILNPFSFIYSIISSNLESFPNICFKLSESFIAFCLALLK